MVSKSLLEAMLGIMKERALTYTIAETVAYMHGYIDCLLVDGMIDEQDKSALLSVVSDIYDIVDNLTD